MAILEEEVIINLHPQTIEYYENKGYLIPRIKNKKGKLTVKKGTIISVKVKDLPLGSNVILTKVCDDCGKEKPETYCQIVKCRERNKDYKDRCAKCSMKIRSISISNKVIPYDKTLEYYAKKYNKLHLLEEYSLKNIKKPNEIHKFSSLDYWWNCPKCKSEYNMRGCHRSQRNIGCPYCAGRRVNSTNCLANTNPVIVKYLKNKEDGNKVTSGSHRVLNFICPDCGNEISKPVKKAIERGVKCSRCSDGVSYPEKFIMNMLDQLDVKYEKEKIFGWSKNIKSDDSGLCGVKKYDFYVQANNLIIEVNGLQHYGRGFESLGGRTLSQEVENDRLKENIAINNQIENYVVIDARESKMDYIKKNILESKLVNILNLQNVKWEKCHEVACKTVIRDVCNYYNKTHSMIKTLEKFNIGRHTAIRYLKQGAALGWTDYDPVNASSISGVINGKKNARKIVQLTLNGKYIKTWSSGMEAANFYSVTNHFYQVCKGIKEHSLGYKWMYKEDYDKYIEEKEKEYINQNNMIN